MSEKGYIFLDMDGVMADLYSVPQWLEKLRNEDYTPYLDAQPLNDPIILLKIIKMLKLNGYKFGVITWGSKNATKDFDRMTRLCKLAWLKRYGLLDEIGRRNFHFLHYGTPKHNVTQDIYTSPHIPFYLVDDEEKNRKDWDSGRYISLDPTENGLIDLLYQLCENKGYY